MFILSRMCWWGCMRWGVCKTSTFLINWVIKSILQVRLLARLCPDQDLLYSPFSLQSTWLGFWVYLYSLDADHEVEVHFSGNYFEIFGCIWQAWTSLQQKLKYVDSVRHYLALDLILSQTTQFQLWTSSSARPRRPNWCLKLSKWATASHLPTSQMATVLPLEQRAKKWHRKNFVASASLYATILARPQDLELAEGGIS